MLVIKKCYALFLRSIRFVLGNNVAKAVDARLRFHKKLNLRNPKNLADKVSWLSVNEYSLLESRCTDKFSVRQYIQEKV